MKYIIYILSIGFTLDSFGQSIETVAQTLQAGDIAPNAKVLDVDEMFPFNDGVARVRKGISYALIDSAGNFIIPFNKWKSLTDSKANLIKVVSLNGGQGLIDSKGKIIVECSSNNFIQEIDNDGYIFVIDTHNNKGYFVNANNNKINSLVQNPNGLTGEGYVENLKLSRENDHVVYLNRQGKIEITTFYELGRSFSDGMAVVGKRDEFGQLKFGFINRKGELAIPFIFSNEPGSFKHGLAFVKPLETDEFKYAYINKKGEIKIKIDKSPNGGVLVPFNEKYDNSDFENGWSEWEAYNEKSDLKNNLNHYILDTLGNFISLKDFLKQANVDINDLGNWFGIHSAKNGGIIITSHGKMGILNVYNKKALPIIFSIPNMYVDFDSVSKLTLVNTYDYPSNKILVEGYINERGIFVIIKGEGSKW